MTFEKSLTAIMETRHAKVDTLREIVGYTNVELNGKIQYGFLVNCVDGEIKFVSLQNLNPWLGEVK